MPVSGAEEEEEEEDDQCDDDGVHAVLADDVASDSENDKEEAEPEEVEPGAEQMDPFANDVHASLLSYPEDGC